MMLRGLSPVALDQSWSPYTSLFCSSISVVYALPVALPLRIKTPRLASSKKATAAPFSLPSRVRFSRPTDHQQARRAAARSFACLKFPANVLPALPPVLASPPLTFYFADQRPRLSNNRSRSDTLNRLRLADSNSLPPSPCLSTSPPP